MTCQHFFQAHDPRSTDEHYLGVYFTIECTGREPDGYGEHFDPGCGPEFTIISVQDDIGDPIELTDAQIEAVEIEIIRRFDYHAVVRAEREDAY